MATKLIKSTMIFLLVSGGFGTDLAFEPDLGFLTKMGDVCSFILRCGIIWEDCTRLCGSGKCLKHILLWWSPRSPVSTHVVHLRAVLWCRSRDTCGWKTLLKKKIKDKFLFSWINSHGCTSALASRLKESLNGYEGEWSRQQLLKAVSAVLL